MKKPTDGEEELIPCLLSSSLGWRVQLRIAWWHYVTGNILGLMTVGALHREETFAVRTVSKNVSKRSWIELIQIKPSTRKHARVILVSVPVAT